MGNSSLTHDEQALVRRCIVAAVDGPFFPDWELQTLFGVNRSQAQAVVASWPNLDESLEVVRLTVNNAFVNLLGYPHHEQEAWDRMVGVDTAEVERVFSKWRAEHSSS
jgi:hypothetical protein